MHPAAVETRLLPPLYRLLKTRAERLVCVVAIALLAAEHSPKRYIASPIARLASSAAVLSAKAIHGGWSGRIAAMEEKDLRDETSANFRAVYRFLEELWPHLEPIACGIVGITPES